MDFLTTEYLLNREVEQVLGCLTDANRLVLQVCLHTGLRVGDVLALRTEQLKPRFAVDLLEKYGDIERVQRALNHSSPSVTLIYAMADKRLQAGALRKAARCGKRLR